MKLPALVRFSQQDVYMSLTILGCTVNCRFRFADCPLIHCDKANLCLFSRPLLLKLLPAFATVRLAAARAADAPCNEKDLLAKFNVCLFSIGYSKPLLLYA